MKMKINNKRICDNQWENKNDKQNKKKVEIMRKIYDNEWGK